MTGTLKARVGGAWVPILGGGPGPSVGNALGIVAMGSMVPNGNLTLPANTQTPVTNNLAFTMLTGRRYRVHFSIRAATVSGGTTQTSINWTLRDGTASFPSDNASVWSYGPGNQGLYQFVSYDWIFDGDNVARSLNVVANPQAIAGSCYPLNQSYFYIEDVGPNMSPALPVAATPVAWAPIALSNFTVVSGNVPAYRKIGDVVSLRGNLTGGSNGVAGASLPVGFRPPGNCEVVVFAYNGGWTSCNVTIGTNGDIKWVNPPGVSAVPGNVSLWNIDFSTTP